MKSKYLSLDSRTGHPEGSLVELTLEELNKLPFNAFMKCLSDEKEEESLLEENELKLKQEEFKKLLHGKKLSPRRIEDVLKHYSSLDEIEKVDETDLEPVLKELLKELKPSKKTKARAALAGKQKVKESEQ